jgi:DNA repair protein RAD5
MANVFQRMVSDPIQNRQEIGLQTVRTTMSHIALRRKKETLRNEIQLVDKTMQTTSIGFVEGTEHHEIYQLLYNIARNYFLRTLNDEDNALAGRSVMHMLALVLRVRQSCFHLDIIDEEFLKNARDCLERSANSGGSALDAAEGERLLDFLRGAFRKSKIVECAVCLDEMEEDSAVILRTCRHIFCEGCLSAIENSLCPMCRAEYAPDDMITKAAARSASKPSPSASKRSSGARPRSPKLQALIQLIDRMGPDEKGVIFSQWTRVLDVIEEAFLELGHTYEVISGKKSADERIDAMMKFDTDRCDSPATPRFMLCSLTACGTGINLTRGNVVFMMDTWWNQAAENQAMDRVHRIGCVPLFVGPREGAGLGRS